MRVLLSLLGLDDTLHRGLTPEWARGDRPTTRDTHLWPTFDRQMARTGVLIGC